VPVTVKHRIGIDKVESYAFVRDFVGTVAEAGCNVFIVHARNAWLKGLSPKENREVPPLRYDLVHQLKQEFPHLVIAINGGFTADDVVAGAAGSARRRDGGARGVPPSLVAGALGRLVLRRAGPSTEREEVEEAMVRYMEREHAARGTPWHSIARHMMGLYNGLPGARRWRQVWSDHRLKGEAPAKVMALAHERVAE
jgi:tRNA-dihydrouridine synthase A